MQGKVSRMYLKVDVAFLLLIEGTEHIVGVHVGICAQIHNVVCRHSTHRKHIADNETIPDICFSNTQTISW